MNQKKLSKSESEFLSYLRSLAIFVIVFGHVGGFWVYRPYSEFLHVFVPVFFFISGAVSFFSYNRSVTTISYYKKRFIGLLVPYYLLCALSLLVFIVTKQEFPTFSIVNILKWIQIRPSNDMMPFPVGQVWFLHTLFIITSISPIYFRIYNKSVHVIYALLFFIVCISVTPLFFNISKYVYIWGNNLYRPLIHSGFYVFGMLAFSSVSFNRKNILIFILLIGILLSVATVYLLNLDIDYAFHTFYPDLYYVSGSFAAISLMLLSKNMLLYCVTKILILKSIFNFFYKHTFSIYLLHSFGIFISESVFGLVDPDKKTITYGLAKLIVVLLITCLLSIPYTKLSGRISAMFLPRAKIQQIT